MKLLTVAQFAKKHKVTRQAIQAAVANNRIPHVELYGKLLINSRTKYMPILGRGRKPAKTKRK